jgi:hypothetical protein
MSVEKRDQRAKTPTDDGVTFLDKKGAADLADGETNSLDHHIGQCVLFMRPRRWQSH